MSRVFIGLGSNLSQPIEQIAKARLAINQVDGVEEFGFSSLYQSQPMGPQDQPNYLNAVMGVDVTLSPLTLLDQLQAIESNQGRVRKAERWGARTIDLDLLLFGEEVIDHERLVVPHYGISERAFVLYPLEEIAGDLDIPKFGSLATLVNRCSSEGVLRLNSSDLL